MKDTAIQNRVRRGHSVLLVVATAIATAGAVFATALAGDSYAQTATRPANTARPAVTGTPANGNTLTANRGRWSGTQPISFTYQWLRCNAQAEGCVTIPGATTTTFVVSGADVARMLRVRVTARNAQGSSSSTSNATVLVGAGSVPSIPVSSVPRDERLVVADVRFSPNPVTSRSQVITARVQVKDTRGLLVNGATVFMRATPRVTTGDTKPTANDGWATLQFTPNANFRVRTGYNTQFYVEAFRFGESRLAGITGTRLVQVRTANR
jgi:hypothetical protein